MHGTATLVWGMLFGAAGLGFFTYGRKQNAIVPLLCGIGLFVVPYFAGNLWILLLLGFALVALPYFVRI